MGVTLDHLDLENIQSYGELDRTLEFLECVDTTYRVTVNVRGNRFFYFFQDFNSRITLTSSMPFRHLKTAPPRSATIASSILRYRSSLTGLWTGRQVKPDF